MKDAITYAHDAGFFSFNVIGWKAEFERLIEAVRADALAELATVNESLTAQSSDQFAAPGKPIIEPLCAHQKQSVTHFSNETWTQQCEACGHLIKSGTYINKDGAVTDEQTNQDHFANAGKPIIEPAKFDRWDIDEARRLLPAMRQGIALLEYVAGALPKSVDPAKDSSTKMPIGLGAVGHFINNEGRIFSQRLIGKFFKEIK